MNGLFAMAGRRPLAYLCQSVALLSVAAATYQLALAVPSEECAAYAKTSWSSNLGDWDEYTSEDWLGELGSFELDEFASVPATAAMLPLGSESLPSRLVGLGCALLGVASSLYGRVRSQAGACLAMHV
ncbi:MAG TPA: hypothetical protein VHC22_31250 [Pirellulales bacterium]|nr:hypothetical protein [Pirellulales bacterium]